MKFIKKFRRQRLTIVALLLLTPLLSSVLAVDLKRADTVKLPFDPPEVLVYEGEFSKAVFRGINIAELRFTADRRQAASASQSGDSSEAFRFIVEAETKGILRKLFNLNYHQRIESTVEPASFSVIQTTKLDEQGKRKRTSEALFDQSARKVVWTERDPNNPDREPRVITSPVNGTVQDIASAFYYLRTQPLAVGRRFEILVSDSGQVYHVPVAVTERKKMKTVIGEVQTLKVEPEVFGDQRLVRGKGKVVIWFTDDARHIPVRARINNELGTLDIKLKSMTGSTKDLRP